MMGSSQSSKKEAEPEVEEREETSHARRSENNVHSISSFNPRLDFAELENEDPIQRRRRILSADHRNCYVLKLERLRQEKLGEKIRGKRKHIGGSTLEELVNPDLRRNGQTIKKIDLNTNSCKSDNINSNNLEYESLKKEKIEGNIQVTNEINKNNMRHKISDNNLNSGLTSNANLRISSQYKCPYLPSQCSVNLNDPRNKSCKSEVIATKNGIIDDKIMFHNEPLLPNGSGDGEIKLEPVDSTKQSVTSNHKSTCTEKENSIKSLKNYDKVEKRSNKTYLNFITQPIIIFEKYLSNPKNSHNKNYDIVRANRSEMFQGYDSIITFESDYSVNGSGSDIKSDFSTNSVNKLKGNSSSTTINSSASLSSIRTFISYEKVKKLFKKRIAETEAIESKSPINISRNSYYQELEELGRGRWKNGVWIPSGKLTKTMQSKILSKENNNS